MSVTTDLPRRAWRRSGGEELQWPILLGLCLAVMSVLACTDYSVWRVSVVVLLAPLLEEILFRVGIQAELTSSLRSGHQANAVASALFVLAHGVVAGPAHGAAVLLPSLLLGECYRRSQCLGFCWTLHALMNAAWLLGLGTTWAAWVASLLRSFAIG